jgi:spermidine synthase
MRKKLFLSITSLGISAAVFQLMVIREFLNIFAGLELVIGIILANWLLLNGIGSYLGKFCGRIKNKIRLLVVLQTIIAVLPFFHIILIRSLRNIIFLPGKGIGILGIFLYSFFNLLPYCLISGFLLTMVCAIYSTERSGRSVGYVYSIDVIGDIIGGLAFSLLLVAFLNPIQISVVIMLLNAACVFFLLSEKKKLLLPYAFIGIFAIAGLFVLNSNINKLTLDSLYPESEIVHNQDTLYGNLVVTKDNEQLNFFFNTVLLFSTDNELQNEQDVHFALSQVENTENILLISGGASGIIREADKYRPKSIDYVEMDAEITETGRKLTTNLDFSDVNVINMDPYLYLSETQKRYDAIIMNMPDPRSAQLSRFYTVEFFSLAKSRLSSGGVFGLSLEGYANFIPEDKAILYSSVHNSLKDRFENILLVPSGDVYMIASDKELSYDIGDLVREKNVYTRYVNNDYLSGILTEDRVMQLENAINQEAPKNTLFHPISYYFSLLSWLRIYGNGIYLIIAILVPLILYYLLKLREVSLPVFCVGFSSMTLELAVIFAFQIIYGYVFRMIGIIIAVFMLGCAAGAYISARHIKKAKKKHIKIILAAMIFYSLILPSLLRWLYSLSLHGMRTITAMGIFPVLIAFVGLLTGLIFPVAARLIFRRSIPKTAGKVYNADLIGSSLGAIVSSAIIIPLLGVSSASYISALVCLLGLLVIALWKVKR